MGVSFFWENSHSPNNSPKWPNFSVCPLLQRFSCDWLISFLFDILRKVEESWEYFVISTQNWWRRIFCKNSCLWKNGPQRCKMIRYLSVSPSWKHLFLRIGSLDMPHVFHEVEGPQVLKLREPAKVFGEILACLFRCFLSLKHKIVCSGWFYATMRHSTRL